MARGIPPFRWLRHVACFLVLMVSTAAGSQIAAGPAPGDDLFSSPKVIAVKMRTTETARISLRSSPRTWVGVDCEIDGNPFPSVAIRLKGSTSFQPFDDRPSFTLDFRRGAGKRRFDGLRRLHLNNSVHDSSYLCEFLASALFRQAGVPAARVAWAKVTLDDRNLGMFVLKEALDDEFLDRHFGRHDGNFYDGGLHHEIDEPLEKDSGKGPDNHADLQKLHSATLIGDPARRWESLKDSVEMECYVSMLAMETLTVHIDGYTAMQNNYRIHFDAETGKATFIVPGMDRMFGDPQWPIPIKAVSALSIAILTTPEGQRRYQQRLAELAPLLTPGWVNDQIAALIRVLGPVEPLMIGKAQELQARMLQRIEFVGSYVAERTEPVGQAAR